MGHARIRLVIVCAAWALTACGDAGGPAQGGAQPGRARGKVVALVNGVPIGSDDVRELAEDLGLSPREALERLEEAALVEQHARARGYDKRPDVEREGRRALVRALLAATVEQEVRPELIPLAEVRERFDAVRAAQGVGADDLPQHEQAVREQLTSERRKAALAQLVETLKRQDPVQLDEATVQKLLSDPALWGGRP